MKRRWVIRGFFVGLLLLCVVGWVVSDRYEYRVGHAGLADVWYVDFHRGQVNLGWWRGDGVHNGGWWADAFFDSPEITRFLAERRKADTHFRPLGFFVINRARDKSLIIPFWFVSVVSAVLLLLVWRSTRPKAEGRAFPVEPGVASGGRK